MAFQIWLIDCAQEALKNQEILLVTLKETFYCGIKIARGLFFYVYHDYKMINSIAFQKYCGGSNNIMFCFQCIATFTIEIDVLFTFQRCFFVCVCLCLEFEHKADNQK